MSSRRFRYGIEHECALLRLDGGVRRLHRHALRRAAGHRRRAARGPGRLPGPARRRPGHQAQALVRRGLRALRRAGRAAALRPEGPGDPHPDPPLRRGGRGRAVRRPAAARRAAAAPRAAASPRSASTRCARSTRCEPAAERVGAGAPAGLARGAHRAPAHGHLRARPQPVVRRARDPADAGRRRPQAHRTTARGWCRCRSPRRSATARPWGGLSARTALRTGARPAVLVFLADGEPQVDADPSLTQLARLPAEVGRIEFKAFDACPDPRSTASCSAC